MASRWGFTTIILLSILLSYESANALKDKLSELEQRVRAELPSQKQFLGEMGLDVKKGPPQVPDALVTLSAAILYMPGPFFTLVRLWDKENQPHSIRVDPSKIGQLREKLFDPSSSPSTIHRIIKATPKYVASFVNTIMSEPMAKENQKLTVDEQQRLTVAERQKLRQKLKVDDFLDKGDVEIVISPNEKLRQSVSGVLSVSPNTAKPIAPEKQQGKRQTAFAVLKAI